MDDEIEVDEDEINEPYPGIEPGPSEPEDVDADGPTATATFSFGNVDYIKGDAVPLNVAAKINNLTPHLIKDI